MSCGLPVIAVNTAKSRHSPQFRQRRSPGLAVEVRESKGVPVGADFTQRRLSRRNWVGAGAGATPVSRRLCRHETSLTRLARSWVSPAPAIPFHNAFRIKASQPGKE